LGEQVKQYGKPLSAAWVNGPFFQVIRPFLSIAVVAVEQALVLGQRLWCFWLSVFLLIRLSDQVNSCQVNNGCATRYQSMATSVRSND